MTLVLSLVYQGFPVILYFDTTEPIMQNKVLKNAPHRFLSTDEVESVFIRGKLLQRQLETLRKEAIQLENTELGKEYENLNKSILICEMEIDIMNKVLDWHKRSPESFQVDHPPLDHAQLLREDRAFQIYLSLLHNYAPQVSSHIIAAEDLAIRSRDLEEEFYRTEVPSDPNLLQFEGVETVFGKFRTNGDELWIQTHDGHQVLVASFSEQIWAIDAARELEERFNGYPVLKKNE